MTTGTMTQAETCSVSLGMHSNKVLMTPAACLDIFDVSAHPGHVLCSPKRVAPRFADLSQEEVADLW